MSDTPLRPGWAAAIRAIRDGAAEDLRQRKISPRDARGRNETADWLDPIDKNTTDAA